MYCTYVLEPLSFSYWTNWSTHNINNIANKASYTNVHVNKYVPKYMYIHVHPTKHSYVHASLIQPSFQFINPPAELLLFANDQ